MERKVVLVTGSGSGIGRAIVESLALAGHIVYASMRDIAGRNKARREEFAHFSQEKRVDLRVIELDVLSEISCKAAVDQILFEEGRLDVAVNNAGMLMIGMGEAFSPSQLLQIFDTNVVSWLRVNRAVLPVMRRQGRGLLVYTGSTTAKLIEPFMTPYVASKAAGEALAEAMSFEVTSFGVETVIVVPGAFTTGTEHFADARGPETIAVQTQYGDLPNTVFGLGDKLDAIDAANGGSGGVQAVGNAVRDVLALPHGERPSRVFVDFQEKGADEMHALTQAKQEAFFTKLGIDRLMSIPKDKR
ncbi:SDR family NAD(P)-dependent oxidoreductase [Agrobacterium salinitolerans]|uniref:SDR family NAD(P)-dependent oxidoreductase n=1 Tax=Agrobacterium salinitolerans TaxID=1183413 RepID=UPI00157349D0|nr:SDR family NAD(P)-dependent oxidoreductase [Agrobacterium salinitolerans]NTA40240.1 SDR family NAD(P)-dependent oxidoreductase [Agrobacterium salinitolerans]